ncbi:DUF86 domain-containing protein [Methanococcoides sp. SA1]|nr:DUF86 domain-containing protein [Methanococcoides sp. SA1]
MDRRGDKVVEIEKYLDELCRIFPQTFKEYMDNFEKRAACERYFEKIIEASIDLVFVIIKENKFRSPDSDRDALKVLVENDVVSESLAESLGNAKSMRNIIIHEYGQIDDELVFNSLKKELVKDVGKLLGVIR